jgi:large subunit ribosomal protein L30
MVKKSLKFEVHSTQHQTSNIKHIFMKKIKITLVKSPIDRPERQKKTLKALGLNKMNATREVEATPQILGMVRKMNHLVKVEQLAN